MSTVTIASNFSFEEVMRYADIPENVRVLFDSMAEKLAMQQEEIERLNKSEELLSEQLSFARTLVTAIDNTVKSTTKMSDFKKRYLQLREDSSFEC